MTTTAAPISYGDLLHRQRSVVPEAAQPRLVRGHASPEEPERSPYSPRTAPESKPKEEPAMPRGVYDRSKAKKRDAAAPPPERKSKRKYARRAKVNGAESDLKTLATDALIEAGQLLAATVRAEVDFEESEALGRALKSYELAEKIREAAGRG